MGHVGAAEVVVVDVVAVVKVMASVSVFAVVVALLSVLVALVPIVSVVVVAAVLRGLHLPTLPPAWNVEMISHVSPEQHWPGPVHALPSATQVAQLPVPSADSPSWA